MTITENRISVSNWCIGSVLESTSAQYVVTDHDLEEGGNLVELRELPEYERVVSSEVFGRILEAQ